MQPSDLYLFGGESGTGKTLTLLSALNMVSKVAHQKMRIVYVSPTAKMLASVLKLLRSKQATACMKDAESVYKNMLIVSSIKPTDKVLCNLSLEQKAILQFLDD